VKDNKFASLYAEFGVTTEEGLLEKLVQESETLPCVVCHREFTIDKLSFLTDDPVCMECRSNGNVN
jgi:hypothetical protein